MNPAPPRGLLLACLLAQLAFGLLAMTVCLPSMPQWAASFGTTQAAVQLSFSGYVLTYGGLQLLYGPLSDRLGRKQVLMAGLALAGLGSVVAALAGSLPQLVAGRVLQGAGSAAGMVVGRAMVQDLFHGPQRTRVMAYVGMVMGLCPPLATVVGGQLHVHLGWQANFVLTAGLAGALLLASWRLLPAHTAPAPPPGGTPAPRPTAWFGALLAAYARLAREPGFLPYVALLSMTTATFYAFLAGAPLVLASQGVGPEGVGMHILCVPVAYVLGNYLTTHLAHRLGGGRIMQLGQGFTAGGLLLVLALGLAGWHTPLAFVLPLVLLGIGHGLLVPPALAGTVGLVPALAGSAAAVTGLMQQLTGALGGYAVGWFHHDGPVALGALMLGFTGLGMLAQALLHAQQRRPRMPAAP